MIRYELEKMESKVLTIRRLLRQKDKLECLINCIGKNTTGRFNVQFPSGLEPVTISSENMPIVKSILERELEKLEKEITEFEWDIPHKKCSKSYSLGYCSMYACEQRRCNGEDPKCADNDRYKI